MRDACRRALAAFMSFAMVLSLLPAQGLAESGIEVIGDEGIDALLESSPADLTPPIEVLPDEDAGDDGITVTSDAGEEAGHAAGGAAADIEEPTSAAGMETAPTMLQTQADSDVLSVTGAYDEQYHEVVWTIGITVPKSGYGSAKLTTYYASKEIDGVTHREAIAQYYDVEIGDKDVYNDLEQEDDRFVVNFYKDIDNARPGITGADSQRTLLINVYTQLDQDWYDASVDDPSYADHVCRVEFEANGTSYTATGTQTIQKPKCEHVDKRTYETLSTDGELNYDLHHWKCPECNQESDEQHDYVVDETSHICTCSKCGLEAVRVTFDAGENATGAMPAVYRGVGSTYELPYHNFSSPEGQWFDKWQVEIGGQGQLALLAGETVTLTENTKLTALWNVAIPYVDDFDSPRYVNSYTKLKDSDRTMVGPVSGSGSWYTVNGVINTQNAPISVTGQVNLILCDGATLQCGGIMVESGATLNVYGQQGGTGTLSRAGGTAINNSGVVTFHGGRIMGSETGIRSTGTNVVLHGGTITGNGKGVVVESGDVAVGHSPKVYGNGSGGAEQDVDLLIPANSKLNVDMRLTDEARIGVGLSVGATGTITKGYDRYNEGVDPSTIFFCNNPDFVVMKSTVDGEASLSGTISYVDVDEQGTRETCYLSDNWSKLFGGSGGSMVYAEQDSWLVVMGTLAIEQLTIDEGHTRLILCDGCSLTVSDCVIVKGTLSIYGQQKGTGKLIVNSTKTDYAAIGGGTGSNGTINIYGGDIQATGAKYGAGIGGGGKGGSGGTINIYGGYVQATGGAEAAAIGGGNDGGGSGKIKITGGTVKAEAKGQYGSGIGGGDGGAFQSITITGGTVLAHGARYGAGIGTGDEPKEKNQTGTIEITGGDVTAFGGDEAAGIGGGNESGGGTIRISGRKTKVFAQGADGNDHKYAAGIGGGDEGPGARVVISDGPYIEAHAATKKGPGQAIGHGNSNSDQGSLIIAADYWDAAVKDGSGTTVLVDKRYETCRGQDATIYPCKHEGGTVAPTPDAKHHTVTCSYCDSTRYEIYDHRYDADGLCICGLHQYTVTLLPGNGSGEPVKIELPEGALQGGADYTLPSAAEAVGDTIGFGAPSPDASLIGWQVGDLRSKPESRIQVKKHVTFTAIWSTPWQILQDRVDATADGGTVTLEDDVTALPQESSIVIASGKSITIDLAGHTLDRGLANEKARKGGAVIENSGTLTLRGGGTITGGNNASEGGGIKSHGTLKLQDVTVRGNASQTVGGGIFNEGRVSEARDVILERVTVSDNTSVALGGGICVYLGNAGTVSFDEVTVSDNMAGSSGGGINLWGSSAASLATIKNSTIEGNTSEKSGGGICCGRMSLDVSGSTIGGNRATGHGGGISGDHETILRVGDTTVSENRAAGCGGGICSLNQLSLSGVVQICDNTATEVAGGVYATKDADGVAVRLGDASASQPSTIVVRGNTSSNNADNLYLNDGQMLLAGTLDASSHVGLTTSGTPTETAPIELTQGFEGKGDVSMLASDRASLVIALAGNGEAVLGVPVKVSFLAGDGTGSMEAADAVAGTTFRLPACTFTEPAGRAFSAWLVSSSGKTVAAGESIDIRGNETVTAQWKSAWRTLQDRIDTAREGDTITLAVDLTAAPDESALTIAKDKKLTLDLAGHTIDRGLTGKDAKAAGSVIINNGVLVLKGEGTVTGGNTTGDGGGIFNQGTLTIDGPTIRGNTAKASAGGIRNCESSSLTLVSGQVSDNVATNSHGGGIYSSGLLQLDGGSIVGNTAGKQAGGVLVQQIDGSRLVVSGSPRVTGNSAASGDNVYLRPGTIIEVADTLGDDAAIGVSTETAPAAMAPVTLTSGLKGHGDESAFTSDNGSYVLGLDIDEEAVLGTPVTVNFQSDGGMGTMDNAKVASGGYWKVSACEFTRDDGMRFVGWRMDGDSHVWWPNQRMFMTGDVVLRASWEEDDDFAFPSFKTVSLVLSGRIGVSFFVDLTMLSEAERAKCYVSFEVNGKEQRADFDNDFTNQASGKYHGFTCYVNSIQMAEMITATLHYGDGLTTSQSYSVKAYIDNSVTKPKFTDAEKALMKAIADYGHYAQPYLSSVNGWKIGEDYEEMTTYFSESYDVAGAREAVAQFAPVKDTSGTKIGSVTALMDLDSGTVVEVLLKAAEGETLTTDDVTATFGVKGKDPVITLRKDGRISVRVENVSTHQLDVPIVVRSDGKEVLRASALSYANIVLGPNSGASSEAQNTMCALLGLHERSQSYLNA